MQFKHLSFFVLTLIVNFNAFCFCADNDALKIFSEGYKKNRDSFTTINCKFRVTHNLQSETVAQAVKGVWQQTAETAAQNGTWLVKDGVTRFELKCELDVKKIVAEEIKKIEQQKSSGSWKGDVKGDFIRVPCADKFVLSSKDSFRFTYSDIINGGNVIPKGVQEGGIRIECGPFDMGIMARNEYSNPYRQLQICINDSRFTGRYEGTEEINGQQLEIVTISTKTSSHQPIMKFGFDPKQGFLATYIAEYNESTHKPICEAFILETKKCSGDRFFPVKSVVGTFRPNNNNKLSIRNIVVTDLDVDTPLDPDLFRFEIPAGSQVSVPSIKDQWMIVEEPLSIMPQDIEQLQQKCIEYAKAYIKKHTTLPEFEPDLKRGNWIKTILIVAGLILIGIGVGNIIRQWKMRK